MNPICKLSVKCHRQKTELLQLLDCGRTTQVPDNGAVPTVLAKLMTCVKGDMETTLLDGGVGLPDGQQHTQGHRLLCLLFSSSRASPSCCVFPCKLSHTPYLQQHRWHLHSCSREDTRAMKGLKRTIKHSRCKNTRKNESKILSLWEQ